MDNNHLAPGINAAVQAITGKALAMLRQAYQNPNAPDEQLMDTGRAFMEAARLVEDLFNGDLAQADVEPEPEHLDREYVPENERGL